MSEVGELLEEWPEWDQGYEARPSEAGFAIPGFTDLSSVMGPGVYALCRFREVVYIGKAKVVLDRIAAHRNALERKRKGKQVFAVPFNKVLVMPCKFSDLDRLEREMIARYKPRYNERLMPKEKPVNLIPLRELLGRPAVVSFDRRF